MVTVVAALIRRDNRFLICQRPANKKRGLLWEFPGGKVEQNETEQTALIREIREELDAEVTVGDEYMRLVHTYPDITVELVLYNAQLSGGEPKLLEHNDLRWITPQEIPQYRFCPADTKILVRLLSDSEKENEHGS